MASESLYMIDYVWEELGLGIYMFNFFSLVDGLPETIKSSIVVAKVMQTFASSSD